MPKRFIRVYMEYKEIKKMQLDPENSLSEIRKILADYVTFPFIFVDIDDEKEIPKENEFKTKLLDILDGKNLYLKKEIIKNNEESNKLISKIKELEIKLNDEIYKNRILNGQNEQFKNELYNIKNKNKNLEDELQKKINDLSEMNKHLDYQLNNEKKNFFDLEEKYSNKDI